MLGVTKTAEFLEISIETLKRWRKQNIGPKFIKNKKNNRIFYSEKDLEEFIKERNSSRTKTGRKKYYSSFDDAACDSLYNHLIKKYSKGENPYKKKKFNIVEAAIYIGVNPFNMKKLQYSPFGPTSFKDSYDTWYEVSELDRYMKNK